MTDAVPHYMMRRMTRIEHARMLEAFPKYGRRDRMVLQETIGSRREGSFYAALGEALADCKLAWCITDFGITIKWQEAAELQIYLADRGWRRFRSRREIELEERG